MFHGAAAFGARGKGLAIAAMALGIVALVGNIILIIVAVDSSKLF